MTKRQAGRRSNSEGSISQRKDGLWEARITLPGGRRRSLYAKTKAEALKKMEEAKGKIADGLRLGPERLTVQIWLDQWLRDFAYRRDDIDATQLPISLSGCCPLAVGKIS